MMMKYSYLGYEYFTTNKNGSKYSYFSKQNGRWLYFISLSDLKKAIGRENKSKATKREPISDELREAIYTCDGRACLKCGEADRAKLSLDHVFPLSLGGDNIKDNLQTLCIKCNVMKGQSHIDYRLK